MDKQELKSSALLMLTAAIWGFAFVAQRVGIKYIGSFTFNGVRFALGGCSLIPLIIYFSRKPMEVRKTNNIRPSATIVAGICIGIILFIAASLQQVGLEYTTVGKAAFITGLYMIFVPIFGLFLKQKVSLNTWIGVILAVTGLYLLSVTKNSLMLKGDLLEVIGAIFWSFHILLIDYFSKRIDTLKLSFLQFITCSVLSMLVAVISEKITLHSIWQAVIPILYGGICSVGIAYTLQVVGQKHARPSHAAIIFSLESVFAGIGGIIILHETMSFRGYTGCIFMLAGMILSQLNGVHKDDVAEREAA